jgi:hypothetical protein
MKKLICLLMMTMVIPLGLLLAQTELLKYMVHEAIVKPSMDAKFNEAAKRLKAACESNKTSFG